MKKFPKPWYRPARGLWYVTLNGVQHNLGPDKDAAFAQYRQLLGQPGQVAVSRHRVASIVADAARSLDDRKRRNDEQGGFSTPARQVVEMRCLRQSRPNSVASLGEF